MRYKKDDYDPQDRLPSTCGEVCKVRLKELWRSMKAIHC